jgi:hypothetical protein
MVRSAKESARKSKAFKPSPELQNYFRAWLEDMRRSQKDLLEASGNSERWFYEVFQADPKAVAWFKQKCESIFSGDKLLEVHQQLYIQAVTPSSNQHHMLKMFMQRFDPHFAERKEVHQKIDVRLRATMPLTDRLDVLREAFTQAQLPPGGGGEDMVEGEIVEPADGEQ